MYWNIQHTIQQYLVLHFCFLVSKQVFWPSFAVAFRANHNIDHVCNLNFSLTPKKNHSFTTLWLRHWHIQLKSVDAFLQLPKFRSFEEQQNLFCQFSNWGLKSYNSNITQLLCSGKQNSNHKDDPKRSCLRQFERFDVLPRRLGGLLEPHRPLWSYILQLSENTICKTAAHRLKKAIESKVV